MAEYGQQVTSLGNGGFGAANPLFAVAEEQFRSDLRMRVRRLLDDLARNDLSMAFLDLAQLHRAVIALAPEQLSAVRATRAAGLSE